MPDNDPRVFFAAERTLLAWVRTSLGLIGLGFVVARFGLVVRLVDRDAAPEHTLSQWLGVALALLGAIAAGISALQHRSFCRSLRPAELPLGYRKDMALATGLGVTVAGLLLAATLAF